MLQFLSMPKNFGDFSPSYTSNHILWPDCFSVIVDTTLLHYKHGSISNWTGFTIRYMIALRFYTCINVVICVTETCATAKELTREWLNNVPVIF